MKTTFCFSGLLVNEAFITCFFDLIKFGLSDAMRCTPREKPAALPLNHHDQEKRPKETESHSIQAERAHRTPEIDLEEAYLDVSITPSLKVPPVPPFGCVVDTDIAIVRFCGSCPNGFVVLCPAHFDAWAIVRGNIV